jgi:uncharacterized repeat protein (TIGR03833 family)
MVIDSRTLVKSSIFVGVHVKIALHKKQKELDYEEGIVKEILSEEDIDNDGIEVELETGYIGRVKEIIDKDNTESEISQRIQQREDTNLEKKETFAYDVKKEERNDQLKKVVCTAVSSMLNTQGGYVYVGVNDDGLPIGLERDFSLITNGGNNDQLEIQIRASLNKYLSNYETVSHFIEITFPTVNGIEICEIKITPSSEPIFLKTTNYSVSINNSNQNRRFDDFYIRDGNGKRLLETHQEFLRYWSLRFGDNEN